ncbi:XRE family transcriptional regulator [Gordonia sp. CPCC 205333]|uniref:XRE family transcriptional regulator n=1 Tax=Gordonia sp. CPCC 205333 TaxID=3140790 RepID=UPI003AF3EA2A
MAPRTTGVVEWTELGDLDAVADGPRSDRPLVKVEARIDGATVIRIAFTGGQRMPDHQAAQPILIVGQHGKVEVTIAGTAITVTAGRAVHIAANVRHELFAQEAAAVTLLVLNSTEA